MKTVAIVERKSAEGIARRALIDWHLTCLSFEQLFFLARIQGVDTVKMIFDEPGKNHRLYGVAFTFTSGHTFVVSDKAYERDVITTLVQDAKQNDEALTFVVDTANRQSIFLLQENDFSDPGGIDSPEAKLYGIDVYTMVKSPVFFRNFPTSNFPPDHVFDVDTVGRV